MTIKYIQDYYSSAYYSLRRNGFKNKLLLLFLSVPAVFYAYYDINARYYYYEWDYPHEYLYYLSAFVFVVLVIMILTINTISFVNSERVRTLKNSFKRQLFECIKEQIPEIKDYCHYKKIHPKYFNDSVLFKSAHSDYIGDDLFHGEYGGSEFEICELHVFKLFKQVFDGLFIRIAIKSGSIPYSEITKCLEPTLISFNDNYDIKINNNRNLIYVAVKQRGKLFEHDSLREIRELENDILVLKDMVKLTRAIINCCQK